MNTTGAALQFQLKMGLTRERRPFITRAQRKSVKPKGHSALIVASSSRPVLRQRNGRTRGRVRNFALAAAGWGAGRMCC